ncbi:MAG: hypothetical protein CMP06_09690, partial [Xanthomonadales bacterium]|nr:hypothetical protein [Xanthomonadales bacterium]
LGIADLAEGVGDDGFTLQSARGTAQLTLSMLASNVPAAIRPWCMGSPSVSRYCYLLMLE